MYMKFGRLGGLGEKRKPNFSPNTIPSIRNPSPTQTSPTPTLIYHRQRPYPLFLRYTVDQGRIREKKS